MGIVKRSISLYHRVRRHVHRYRLFRHDYFMVQVIPAIVVFLTLMGITVSLTIVSRQRAVDDFNATKEAIVTSTQNTIRVRLALYEKAVQGGVGLFRASDVVSPSEWRDFAQNFQLDTSYPGVQGMGYAAAVRPDQLPTYIQAMRDTGRPEFRIFPEGERSLYAILTYMEPSQPSAQGYDMFSESMRREAMELARDSGRPTLTGLVRPVIAAAGPSEPAFILYAPYYAAGADISTPQTRSQALRGFVFAPFRASRLFGTTLNTHNLSHFGVQIYDQSIGSQNLLYQTANYNTITRDHPLAITTDTMTLHGRTWVLRYAVAPQAVSAVVRFRPRNILFAGTVMSAVIAGFVWMLLLFRTRTLAYAEEQKLQQARDDLLSLASHQLRTPATGVKQYVGMVLEGYAGNITATQRSYLEKANQSNDRQIKIVNDLLAVAHINDNGIKKTMRWSRCRLSDVVADVVQEQRHIFAARKQKVTYIKPKRAIIAQVDVEQLRMAIENLVNNASKYSAKGKTIIIRLSKSKGIIALAVHDEGVGIATEDIRRLFQKFSRINNELSVEVGGSGLGLYMAQAIVMYHGGSIEVESEPGKGSTFTIVLPVHIPGLRRSIP